MGEWVGSGLSPSGDSGIFSWWDLFSLPSGNGGSGGLDLGPQKAPCRERSSSSYGEEESVGKGSQGQNEFACVQVRAGESIYGAFSKCIQCSICGKYFPRKEKSLHGHN